MKKQLKSSNALTLIKQVRVKLIEEARPMLEPMIREITECTIRSLHTDISTNTGERVIIFTLDRDLEEKNLSARLKKRLNERSHPFY